MDTTLGHTFVQMARSRLVVHLTGQIRACLDALSDEQIWWRPNSHSNAVGNLVLHCVGSTRHYIGTIVGGTDFVRNRDAEFAAGASGSRAELRVQLDAAVSEADQILRRFDPERLLETTDRPTPGITYLEVIDLQVAHYATHTGQIAYATKMITDGGIDDIWRKTPSR